MNKVEKLSAVRDLVFDALSQSTTISQFAQRVFGKSVRLSSKDREQFKREFGIDLVRVLTENRNAQRLLEKEIEANAMVRCDNCGKEFRNGNHPKSKKSCRHQFCSNKCAKQYAANAKKESRRKKISKSMKSYRASHTHEILCDKCGKPFSTDQRRQHGICSVCLNDYHVVTDGSKPCMNRHRICRACGAIDGTCKRPDICRRKNSFKLYSEVFGFDMTTIGSERVYDEFERIREMLRELYWDQNMAIPQIMRKFQRDDIKSSYLCQTGNFMKLMKQFINLRSPKEGQKIAVQYGSYATRNTVFKSGFHVTWDGQHVSYRSSYELDFCKILDAGRIRYVVEGLVVDYYDSVLKQDRFAIPDFYLPDYNMIVEVKSSYTFDRQNMIDKVTAYAKNGYDFILEYEHKSYTFEDMLRKLQTSSLNINSKI